MSFPPRYEARMLNHEVTLEIMAASALLKMLLPGDASYEQRLSTLGFQLCSTA
jgi:hypothetical protein